MPRPTSIECAPLLNPNGARSGHYMLPDVTGFADDFMRLQLGEQLYNVSSALVTLGKDVNAGVYTHTLLPGDCGTFALQSYMLQQGLDPALSGIAPEHVEVSSDPYRPMRKGKAYHTKVGDVVLMINNIGLIPKSSVFSPLYPQRRNYRAL